MINPQYVTAVAALLMRVSHFTNVDAVKSAMVQVGAEMDADMPSNETAKLRVDLAESQKTSILRGQAAIGYQSDILRLQLQLQAAQDQVSSLTIELAAREPLKPTDASPQSDAAAGSTVQEPADGVESVVVTTQVNEPGHVTTSQLDGLSTTQTGELAQPENS